MNQELREKLLQMKAEDGRVRGELAAGGALSEGYHPKMEAVHLKNAAQLETIIERHGWPGKSLVGKDGAEAAWLIVQHTISRPDFSRYCLRLIQQAVAAGEAEPYQAAYLEDRIRFFEGKPQRYGTQADWNDEGKMQVWTIEDEEKVNEYRAEVGLPPLERLIWDAAELGEQAPDDLKKRNADSLDWARKVGWR